MKILLLPLLLTLALKTFSQSPDSLIVLGKRHSINSKILEEKREFWVYLPPSYNLPDSKSHHYPVLYLLDGDTYFIPTAGIIDDLGQCYAVPEMIVVAIIYNDRMHDILPVPADVDRLGRKNDALKNSGHADDFLNFVEKELFPKIETTYRTMPYRILVGHSSAGLTVLYTLLKKQSMFSAYIAVDPGALKNNETILYQYSAYLKQADLSSKSLFISGANNESNDDPSWNDPFIHNKALISALEADKHSKLKWKYKYYPDDNHITVYVNTFYDAIRFTFQRYSINFTKERFQPDLIKNRFEQFSKESKVKFTPPEYLMNRFGTEAMSFYPTISRGLDAAIKYFQFNLDNFPGSTTSLLNLGDAWLKNGDRGKALTYYKKVLEIEKNNETAKRKIDEIE